MMYSYRGITQKSDRTTAAHVNEESQWSKKQVAEEYIHCGSVSVKVKTRPLNIWLMESKEMINTIQYIGGLEGNREGQGGAFRGTGGDC